MEKKMTTKGINTPKKPTYEELNNYVNELMMENRNLRQRLGQVMEVHNKLPWLFEIIKNKEMFEPDYVSATVTEIQLILPPFKEDNTESTENLEENK